MLSSSNLSGDPSNPLDGLLAGYAVGSLKPHFHALIESHLILSDANRDFVRSLEAVAGAELEALDPGPVRRSARDEVLAAIYAGGWYGRPRPQKLDPEVPDPIARLIDKPLDALKWKLIAPGVREHRIAEGEIDAVLVKVTAGHAIPSHTHEGIEATLVLRGAFTDRGERFKRGDVSVVDGSVDHKPVAERGGECVCFTVADAPFRLTGPIGRIVERVFRR